VRAGIDRRTAVHHAHVRMDQLAKSDRRAWCVEDANIHSAVNPYQEGRVKPLVRRNNEEATWNLLHRAAIYGEISERGRAGGVAPVLWGGLCVEGCSAVHSF
jgi:hypothetical protein